MDREEGPKKKKEPTPIGGVSNPHYHRRYVVQGAELWNETTMKVKFGTEIGPSATNHLSWLLPAALRDEILRHTSGCSL